MNEVNVKQKFECMHCDHIQCLEDGENWDARVLGCDLQTAGSQCFRKAQILEVWKGLRNCPNKGNVYPDLSGILPNYHIPEQKTVITEENLDAVTMGTEEKDTGESCENEEDGEYTEETTEVQTLDNVSLINELSDKKSKKRRK